MDPIRIADRGSATDNPAQGCNDDDNALFRQRQADQAAVSALIKSRGSFVEIK
jgi:hypothetical protein